MTRPLLAFLTVLALWTGAPTLGPALAADDGAGVLYPAPKSTEVVRSGVDTREDASEPARRRFALALSRALSGAGLGDVAVAAVGAKADQLALVALRSGLIDTPFRARALAARLGGLARDVAPFVGEPPPAGQGFYDLAKAMGFERVTLSDGGEMVVQTLVR